MYDFFHSVPGWIVLFITVLSPISIYVGIKEFKAWDRGHLDRLVSHEATSEVPHDQYQSLTPKPEASSMKSRPRSAMVVRWIAYTLTLVVLWQAVRFSQGQVGVPLVDQLIPAVFAEHHALKKAGDFAVLGEFFAWSFNAIYYLCGIGIWLSLALFVKGLGWTVARIVEIGFDAYKAEVDEERRRENIRVRRLRRTEALKDKSQPTKSAFPWTALALGILLGKMF